ncbi:MAG: CBS domain-containing protein [Pseudomonadota bacterium]
MTFRSLNDCRQSITEDDIYEAMKKIPGYLDITPSDCMELYRVAFDHAISKLKNAIKADQIMTRKVITVNEKATLIEVVKKMADNEISGLPVIKNDQTITGIISEKDFLKRMNDDKKPSFMRVVLQCLQTTGCIAADFNNLVASDIMSFPCITTLPQTPVIEVANIMDQKNINRVPVMDDNLKLVGIIARSDIVQTLC